MLSRRHAHVRKPSLYSTIWAPPHKRVHNGFVPAPRPPTILIPGSHRVPPLVPAQRKVLSMPKNFDGSRRPLTGHQRVHRSLNAPPCALTVFHRLHEMYTSAHGRFSRHHVTATLDMNYSFVATGCVNQKEHWNIACPRLSALACTFIG